MSQSETTPPTTPPSSIEPRLIEREMRESYLTYALSVIHSRALPDVRDGLKPSQRRILVAMNDLNLSPRAKYRKCAKIAGDTSGNYHPHGEAVVYPTLVRMAQDFSLRYPMVDGQGNFGSIDGDAPAAMRYTEARMSGIAVEMMTDLEKETVDLEPNYDDTRMQPVVLPSRFPNLLCNGSDGIAVGMATSLPPHNLREICAALRMVLDDSRTTIAQLCEVVKGPDFPTGGIVMGRNGIRQAYATGRGLIRLRGRWKVEDIRTKQQIVVTEIPFQVRKTAIIEKIVEVVKDGRITGISDVRDESDRDGMRLVIELKKNEDPQVVANQLFQYTPLQETVSIINLAVDDRQPRTLNLRQLLDAYIRHRRDVIRRRTKFLLRKAEERKHIVEGLRIAVGNIDEVVRIIRASSDRDDARAKLRAAFGLSERQSQAIVDMRLGSLTGLEIGKLEAEYQELLAEIADLNDILAREIRVTNIIKADLDELEELYGDDRRTEISPEEIDGSFDMEELIAEEMMVVTVTRDGWIKRTPLDQYRAQRRGGQGVKGSEAKEGDATRSVFAAATKDYLMFFTSLGKVHWAKVWAMPEAARDGKGRAIGNLVQLEAGEKVESVLRVPHFDKDNFVFFATRQGTVKKTSMALFSRPKRGGIRAITLSEGDELVGVAQVKKGETILLSSAGGRTIRFHETSVRAMGRTAGGVRGLRLLGDDRLVGLVVAGTDGVSVLSACAHGYGKRTAIAEYPIKGRGGQGVMDIKTTERNGKVVGTALVRDGDEILFITTGGKAVRMEASGINAIGRNTQGVRLVDLREGDALAGLDVVSEADLERYVAERAAAGPVEPLPDIEDGGEEDEGDEVGDLVDDEADEADADADETEE